MIDKWVPKLSEWQEDITLPAPVDIVSLIDKAAKFQRFTDADYHWLYICLLDLYESHEYKLRLRLMAVERELKESRRSLKESS